MIHRPIEPPASSRAILRVVARDVQHVEVALERIRSAEAVDHSESIIVLSRVVDRGRP